jgi:hypothetical protein
LPNVWHAGPVDDDPRAQPAWATDDPASEWWPSPSDVSFEQLEKLGRLRDAGVVTTEEFETKKKELLSVAFETSLTRAQ